MNPVSANLGKITDRFLLHLVAIIRSQEIQSPMKLHIAAVLFKCASTKGNRTTEFEWEGEKFKNPAHAQTLP